MESGYSSHIESFENMSPCSQDQRSVSSPPRKRARRGNSAPGRHSLLCVVTLDPDFLLIRVCLPFVIDIPANRDPELINEILAGVCFGKRSRTIIPFVSSERSNQISNMCECGFKVHNQTPKKAAILTGARTNVFMATQGRLWYSKRAVGATISRWTKTSLRACTREKRP